MWPHGTVCGIYVFLIAIVWHGKKEPLSNPGEPDLKRLGLKLLVFHSSVRYLPGSSLSVTGKYNTMCPMGCHGGGG